MKKQNRNLILLVIGVIFLFSFKKATKRKGSIIIENPFGDQYTAKKGAQIYDQFDPSIVLYNNFKGGEWINILEDTGVDYHVTYVSPEKGLIEGFINYNDINK